MEFEDAPAESALFRRVRTGLPWLGVVTWLGLASLLPSLTNARVLFNVPWGIALAAAATMAVWFAATVVLLNTGGFGTVRRSRTVAWYAFATVPYGLAFLLFTTDRDFVARVQICETALLEEAARPEYDSSDYYSTRNSEKWVGLIYVMRIDKSPSGAVAFVTANGLLDDFGPLYLPPGSSPPIDWCVVRPLFGHWHLGRWSF